MISRAIDALKFRMTLLKLIWGVKLTLTKFYLIFCADMWHELRDDFTFIVTNYLNELTGYDYKKARTDIQENYLPVTFGNIPITECIWFQGWFLCITGYNEVDEDIQVMEEFNNWFVRSWDYSADLKEQDFYEYSP